MNELDYECALTGIQAESGIEDESDGLGDMPLGWTRITINRRRINPRYVLLQRIKEAQVQSLILSIPEEHRAGQLEAVELQVDAGYYAMEQDTPLYVTDEEEVVFLSDSVDIAEDINELRQSLGLEAFELLLTEADEDDLPEDEPTGEVPLLQETDEGEEA
jgi:hypothetical protein